MPSATFASPQLVWHQICLPLVPAIVAVAYADRHSWLDSPSVWWMPLLIISFTSFNALRRKAARLSGAVKVVPVARLEVERALLEADGYTAIDLDLREVHDEGDLAAALDAKLGSFQFPEDPKAKIRAHLGHERRGAGHLALLLLGTENMRRDNPELLYGFAADWARVMRGNLGQRLLFLSE